MSGGGEYVDLPQFVRQIRVSNPSGETDVGDSRSAGEVDAARKGFTGVLHPFGGVLQVGVITGEWPTPALSHLVLGALVERSLSKTGSDDDPLGDDTGGKSDSSASGGVDPELRVRDLVRGNPDRAPPAESNLEVDTSSDLGPSLTVRTVTDAGSRSGSTPASSNQPNITTDRMSTTTIRPYEGPELTVTRHAPTVTRPAPGTPEPNASASDSQREASERPSLEGAAATRSRATESWTDAGIESHDRPGQANEPGVPDTEVVTAPQPARHAQGVQEVEAGTAPGESNRDTEARPRMAVRTIPDPTANGDGTDSSTGRKDDPNTPGESGPRTVGPTQGKQEQATHPQRIDDLVDVERLADRLSRVFERNARIERERRGR